MESLKNYIKDQKPNISESTINSYYSVITNIHKRVFDDKEFNISDFEEAEKVLKHLADMKPSIRKTKISAIVAICANSLYKDQIEKDCIEAKNEIDKQEKTEKQKANSLDKDELDTILDQLKREAESLLKKKHQTIPDLMKIQDYILLCLLGGKYIAPRRAKDFTYFKIKNIDTLIHNRLEGSEFVFVSYKTASTYGEQRVKIPIQLKNILKKWLLINGTEWLLFDTKLTQLQAPQVTQRFNKIFGKNASINHLRHAYLTDKFGHTIELNNDISDTMTSMGSSVLMLTTYVQHEDK